MIDYLDGTIVGKSEIRKAERRLILSLHDVSPRDFHAILKIDRLYEELGVGARYAMLVVPNFFDAWRLEDHPEFVRWLKARAQSGAEMMLHGYYHRDTTPPAARNLKTRMGHALFGEGEFASINVLEAQKRLEKGRSTLEYLLDQKIDSFVAPAWQYSAGTRTALAHLGFKVAENRMRVWSPASGAVLSKSPVVAYSSRTLARCASSILWSRMSTRVLSSCAVIRHAVHPADIASDRLMDEIRRSLRHLLADRKLISYRQLLDAPKG